ncbi:MAG: hypothetical protein ACM3ZE_02465, partial [Myxococcales bacterium]
DGDDRAKIGLPQIGTRFYQNGATFGPPQSRLAQRAFFGLRPNPNSRTFSFLGSRPPPQFVSRVASTRIV